MAAGIKWGGVYVCVIWGVISHSMGMIRVCVKGGYTYIMMMCYWWRGWCDDKSSDGIFPVQVEHTKHYGMIGSRR